MEIHNKDSHHMMNSDNVRLGCYAQKLKGKQAWRYKQKLKDIENVDPYLLHATDDGVSSVMDNFPKICFGDIYVYLILKKSAYTYTQVPHCDGHNCNHL
jgi:hypothetical protein